MIYNNKEVYGLEKWEGDFGNCFKAGDYVNTEIAEYFCDCVPPKRWSGDYLQMGEPVSHKLNSDGNYQATYRTFKKIHTEHPEFMFDDSDVWEYLGCCFVGEENER